MLSLCSKIVQNLSRKCFVLACFLKSLQSRTGFLNGRKSENKVQNPSLSNVCDQLSHQMQYLSLSRRLQRFRVNENVFWLHFHPRFLLSLETLSWDCWYDHCRAGFVCLLKNVIPFSAFTSLTILGLALHLLLRLCLETCFLLCCFGWILGKWCKETTKLYQSNLWMNPQTHLLPQGNSH